MYTNVNFKTKKAFKEAVANGEKVTIWQPGGMFDPPAADRQYTGTTTCEGPHYPAAHTWCAQVTMENGLVVKVK